MSSQKIGLIGIGRMGRGMGNRILHAGFPLTVHDIQPEAGADLLAGGACWAQTPAELARDADVILLSLPATEIVETVLFGELGVVQSIQSGCVVIDTSTISPVATRLFAQRLAEKGASMLDAPVSGGSEGASKGTLAAMVGGSQAVLDHVRPVLDVLTRTVTHVGDSGSGQAVKMVNQVILVGNVMAMSEGILLAKHYGLDLEAVLQAVQGGAAGSWMLSNLAPSVINEDWNPSFTIELQLKDLRIALDTADRLGVPLPGTAQIFQLYRSIAARGKGQDGNHSLIQALYALLNE